MFPVYSPNFPTEKWQNPRVRSHNPLFNSPHPRLSAWQNYYWNHKFHCQSLQLQSKNLWVKYPTAIKKKKPIKYKKKTHNSYSMYSPKPISSSCNFIKTSPTFGPFFHLQACSFARIKWKPISSTYKLILDAHTKSAFFSLTSSFCEHIKPKPIFAHLFTYKLILCAHQTKTHFCPSFHLQAHSVCTSNQNPFWPIFSLTSSFCALIRPKPLFLLTSSFHELMKPNTIFHNFFSMYWVGQKSNAQKSFEA